MSDHYHQWVIEGFGGKRALGCLLKNELCQKHSKFGMQFCLGALDIFLHVFFAEACFVFEILRMQKKTVFIVMSAPDSKDGNSLKVSVYPKFDHFSKKIVFCFFR